MPSLMFDFSAKQDADSPQSKNSAVAPKVCTYTEFESDASFADAAHPILVLDDKDAALQHHVSGVFMSPDKRTAFRYQPASGESCTVDILRMDSRFTALLSWLGDNQIGVRLSGAHTEQGFAVYKIREVDSGGETKLSAEDGFLQFMITRLLQSRSLDEAQEDDDTDPEGDDMKLTSLQSITDFLSCTGRTLPSNIRLWARRNLAVARSKEVSPEERRHAQRALSIMLNVQWKSDYFEAIDPVQARKISFRSTERIRCRHTDCCSRGRQAPENRRLPTRSQEF